MATKDPKTLFKQMGKVALKAGEKVVEKALLLFYATQNPKTPKWAKRIIYGALAYLLMPVDLIPDVLPVVGFSDDLGIITLALATIAFCITPEVKQKAQQTKDRWFHRQSTTLK